MEIVINAELMNQLCSIPWFQNCGEGIPPLGLKVMDNGDVLKSISSLKWENTVLEHQGDITSKLCDRSLNGEGDEMKLWNDLVKEWKSDYLPKMDSIWARNLDRIGLNVKEVIDDVRFNVLSIVMADAYAQIVPMDNFFKDMLAIYAMGYLPCGWSGKRDKGAFYIY